MESRGEYFLRRSKLKRRFKNMRAREAYSVPFAISHFHQAVQSLIDLGLVVYHSGEWVDRVTFQPVTPVLSILATLNWDWTRHENYLWLQRNWRRMIDSNLPLDRLEAILIQIAESRQEVNISALTKV
jgi:hypothetical protein